MTAPVTVSITRTIAPGHSDEMLAWIRAGSALATRFDGFLGSGWVRPAAESVEWHMLYRFADEASLATWEASPQRRWWLGAAQGLVGESRVERRTGIEGWFDPPDGVVAPGAAAAVAPVRRRWLRTCAARAGTTQRSTGRPRATSTPTRAPTGTSCTTPAAADHAGSAL
jgi:quinol monooxygenase YgiN